MCNVCAEWQLGKLTNKEALRNIGELINTEEPGFDYSHYYGVVDQIMDKEMGASKSDDERDIAWHKENYGD